MGCLRLTYCTDFFSVWRRDAYEKSDQGNFLPLGEKKDGKEKRDNYYPFGLTFNEYSRENSVPNRFKYNKKELQDDLSFNMYDYGARFYDPAIAKFSSIDPHTEKYSSWTPYLYAANDPVRYEDTNGEGPGDAILGFVAAVADNVTGGLFDVRGAAAQYVSNGGAADFNHGQDKGDVTSIVVGAALIDVGGTATGGGTLVTVGSGGVLGEVGVPVAAAGLAATAVGTVTAGTGAISLTTQKGRLNADGKETHGNSKDSQKPSGNYENTHESGKTYNGVGNEKRMNQSGNNVSKKNNDPVAKQKWESAPNKKEAYKKEHQDIQKNGGAGNTQRNYNQRNSPGKKLQDQ